MRRFVWAALRRGNFSLDWAVPLIVDAQVSLSDVGSSRGIGPQSMAPGLSARVAAADYDNGGIGLFAPTGQGAANQSYRNLGKATSNKLRPVSVLLPGQ